jgi:acetoin utilization deacetylase AcuC-like enzyme
MKTGLHIDKRYLDHATPNGHPERADRIRRLLDHQPLFELEGIVRMEVGRVALPEELLRVHDRSHLDLVASTDGKIHSMLDPDTHTSEASYRTALLAAGGVLNVIDAVMNGDLDNGLALVRPPGHHAEADQAMGFCLFNNVAVGARHLTDKHGIDRVLIVDWDVHHGNGTQRSFYDDNGILFMSIHQFPFYPGTGAVHETGHGVGEGFTVNVPMTAGSGDTEYRAAFENIFRPIAVQFDPDFVLVSAGFDAHRDDPLGGMRVTEQGYATMTSIVMEIARECAQGRCVAILEGGYNLDALASSVATVARTMGTVSSSFGTPGVGPSATDPIPDAISPIRLVHSEYWDL